MTNTTRWLLPLLALAAAGCGSTGAPRMATYDAGPPAEHAPERGLAELGTSAGFADGIVGDRADPAAGAGEAIVRDVGTGAAEAEPASAERLLIYSGQVQVAVGDVEEALDAARGVAEDLGGYFQSLADRSITIRIPADRWEEALARVGALGRVLRRRIDAADVTEEVVDLRLRLRNARALGKRLEELLAEAQTVEETLKVEKELNRVRTEIERLEGRLRFLSDRIAFSTLVIEFVEAASAPTRPQALPFPWLRELGLGSLLGLSRSGRKPPPAARTPASTPAASCAHPTSGHVTSATLPDVGAPTPCRSGADGTLATELGFRPDLSGGVR